MFQLSQPALLALQQQQANTQSQPWFPEYQALKGALWNTNNTGDFYNAINSLAAKYGIAGDPNNPLGQLAGKDIADSQGARPPWYKEDSGISPLQAIGIGVTLGTGAAAAGGSFGTGAGVSGAGGGAAAGGGAGALDTSGFGGSFDAAGMGGPQYDMTGWGSSFDAGNMGGKAYDMTGWASPFDSAGMTTENAYSMPNTVTPPQSTSKSSSPLDKARQGLSLLPSGGGMMGGGFPALQQPMAPASLFTPVMPGALYPFGR